MADESKEIYAKVQKYGSEQYAEYFGMTEQEISDMLTAQGLAFEFIDKATYDAAQRPVS